eukprot:scaffold32674_cov29-Tisochrysis_lutea.AAC.1
MLALVLLSGATALLGGRPPAPMLRRAAHPLATAPANGFSSPIDQVKEALEGKGGARVGGGREVGR